MSTRNTKKFNIFFILESTFRAILLTSTKLVTKGFIKLIVGFNKSISEQNKDIQAKKNAPTPLSIKVFQEFQAIIKRIPEQTKNRKPEPAVDKHFRKVFLSFYFFYYLVVMSPSGSTVNSGLSAIVPSGLM